jgi:hypothetical protein
VTATGRLANSIFVTRPWGHKAAALVAAIACALVGALMLDAILALGHVAGGDDGVRWPAALALHAAACIGWGVVFGLLALPLDLASSTRGALLLGVVVGLGSELLDVGPPVPTLHDWLGHVVFGLTFVFFPPLFQMLVRPRIRWDDPRIR